MAILSNPMAERRMIEDFLPESLEQTFSDPPPMLESPNAPRKTARKIPKPVKAILAALNPANLSQGFVPKDRERMSAALPGPTGPMSTLDAMSMLRKTKDTADAKLTTASNQQAIPQQLLQLLGAASGRRPYSPSPSAQKAPWPPPANAPTRKMTTAVRPEIPSTPPSIAMPSSGLSTSMPTPPPTRKATNITTPQNYKDGAEHLKMRQLSKFIEDMAKASNPMLDMLIRGGKDVASRIRGENSAPMTRGSMKKTENSKKRGWLDAFDGIIE